MCEYMYCPLSYEYQISFCNNVIEHGPTFDVSSIDFDQAASQDIRQWRIF